jgi:hypothetical protein
MVLRSRAAGILAVIILFVFFPGCGDEDLPSRVTNAPPIACFTVNPAGGTTETLFTFDAGCSQDPQESAATLQIRWDWENDGVWNTEWSATKIATHRFETAGMAVLRMEVRDTGGLTHAILDSVAVGSPNQPPAACFTVNLKQGTVETVFAFDASYSSDEEDAIDSMQVRWDWENDGVWETEWTLDKTANHQYPTIGWKIIRMETRDTEGLRDESLDSLEVVLDYLGRTPPGMTPQVFPPQSLRAQGYWTWHGSPAFSPGGREVFFCKYIHLPVPEHSELTVLRLENGHWGAPQPAPFGDTSHFENNPWYSANGDTLYYVAPSSTGFISFVTRTSDGWSAPVPLSIPVPAGATSGLQFSFSKQGTLYAELWEGGDSNIYRWKKQGGGFLEAEKLDGTINTASPDYMPFIDPEERFLLFCSRRPGGFGLTDIYISRAQEGGGWSEAVNLGPQVNSSYEDGWPSISPDGRYLFFVSPRAPGSRGYEPLWVDVRFLDGLRF